MTRRNLLRDMPEPTGRQVAARNFVRDHLLNANDATILAFGEFLNARDRSLLDENRCESCACVLPSEDDCTADGMCAKLAAAGAVNVTIGVMHGPWGGRESKTLFVRGGWLCRDCATKYGGK